jgi:hypothetical protein
MTIEIPVRPAEHDSVFPPALVPLIRAGITPRSACLHDVTDEQLAELLTTIFFAGLETYEGEHQPIGVAFVGRNTTDVVMTEGGGSLPLYRWKIMRFAAPRAFVTRELVKLAVAGVDRRIYVVVSALDDGTLAISGLAREGLNVTPDPFVKIVATRPGCLSIRSGRDLVLRYERGAVLTTGHDEVFFEGPLHNALSAIARQAGVDADVVRDYLAAVHFLVRELVAHGHGGILIVSAEDDPEVALTAPYRVVRGASLAGLLRLAWRAGRKAAPPTPGSESLPAFGALLRDAFVAEAERVVEEVGRLSAIDGAVLLNHELALVAFGLILPVGQPVTIVEGTDTADPPASYVDFGARGTRHRASAAYAAAHPGSVVFVASEDGQVSCLVRERPDVPVRLWRMAGAETRT